MVVISSDIPYTHLITGLGIAPAREHGGGGITQKKSVFKVSSRVDSDFRGEETGFNWTGN